MSWWEPITYSQYFNSAEFDSPDMPGSGQLMSADFIEKLTWARHRAGVPFIITSGYRTYLYNTQAQGARNSAHMKGLAADISCDISSDRFKILRALIHAGFTRIGIGLDFIHVDMDNKKPTEVIWMYS